jgi:hypothetical protein
VFGRHRAQVETDDTCQVYWGLEWCSLRRGHAGQHIGSSVRVPPPPDAALSGPDAPAFTSTAEYIAPHRVRRMRKK